jgi:DNA primase
MGNAALQQRQDIFELIKGIPIKEIIERYSPNPLISKGGKFWTVCPLHSEKTPSLSLKGNKWKCFGCNESGDGVDFVCKLYNLSLIDSAKLIASDFGLNWDQPLTLEQKQKIQARQRRQKLEKLWNKHIANVSQNLAEVRRAIWLNLDNLPNPEAKEFTLKLMDIALDTLDYGSLEERLRLIHSDSLKRWLI